MANKTAEFIPYHINTFESKEMLERSQMFYTHLNERRTVRDFSNKAVPKTVMENLIMTASTAPSGAHKQPWTFCLVGDSEIKKSIRTAAEEEEYISYTERMSAEWLKDLEAFGTDWHKPFLEVAPWLIIVFKKPYDLMPDGTKRKNYYVNESVGIAVGLLLAAIHHAGLISLTHTPSPMNFLQKILNRPSNERPFLLIPVGYPAENAQVPKIERKPKDEVIVYY